MIPKQLALHNFFSYQEAVLDFTGLHVACVAGANGAGKSSLLEAIAWCLWGHSRSAAEDDVIYLGAQEVSVEFVFEHRGHIYRVRRGRRRRQSSFLEFQIRADTGYRSLTQRSMRATQQLIIKHLRISYDTFAQSAYLRQGHSDAFMAQRPAARKQILADLLKLSRYDELAAQAKEQEREYLARSKVLSAELERQQQQLEQHGAIANQQQQLQQLAQQTSRQLQELEQRWEDLRQLQVEQQQLEQLHRELEPIAQRRQQLKTELAAAADIEAGYAQLEQHLDVEARYEQTFSTYQRLQLEQTQQQNQQLQRCSRLEAGYQQLQLRLEDLSARMTDLKVLLAQQSAVEASVKALHRARQQLLLLDQRQITAAPLLQRRQEVQLQIRQASAKLAARLEAIDQTRATLLVQQLPELPKTLAEVRHRLAYLEQRRAYQDQVRQKGQERREFMIQLQTEQRTKSLELGLVQQRLQIIQQPHGVCPLCNGPLDDREETLVQQLQEQETQLRQRLLVIREQLTTAEREIQILRQEYRQLEDELGEYGTVQQHQGELQAQLQANAAVSQQLAQLTTEQQHLEQCLRADSYAQELHQEYQQLSQQLAALSYDERDHALVRNQVDKLRWAEFKQAELAKAQRQLAQYQQEHQTQTAALADIKQQLQQEKAAAAEALQATAAALEQLNYSPQQHQTLRQRRQQLEPWRLRYQNLAQARQLLPKLEQRCQRLEQQIEQQQQRCSQLAVPPELVQPLPELAEHVTRLRAERERQLSQLGRLEQQLFQIAQLQQLAQKTQQEQLKAQQQQKIYRELGHAFGRNGIQALMIENLLPQLEAETNHVLARLSDHRLHVRFITQRSGRKKAIDTLDILISDPQGTRPYETYSGGEAFRVNFAIRLALARLLAQRSGMALQMLIIDEGFGSQDREGCDRLIGAINAISSDFACILTVTHRDRFREAFSTRIDVVKTAQGSQLRLST